MINVNWVKNIDGSIYEMKFISTMGSNYLVEVSSYPIDHPSESRKSLVELSSEEMIMCEKDPVNSFEFIHNTQAGMILVLSSLLHYPDRDPNFEFENITVSHTLISTFDQLFDRRKQASIEHSVDGCVINNNSCLLKVLNWVPTFKEAKRIINADMAKHIETIYQWEAANCPKPTKKDEETTEEPSSETTDDWNPKTWNGLSCFYCSDVWTDGENVYYSGGSNQSLTSDQYVLDKSTSTWSKKKWSGLTIIYGRYIWTDGNDIYYSNGSDQYILDKATSTWSKKTWNGFDNFYGDDIWSDGKDVYYSYGTAQYILDKSTSTWNVKTWNGLKEFDSKYIWTDGEDIYYSFESKQYILDKSTSTWSKKTWKMSSPTYGIYIWTDNENVYYSNGTAQYVLDKATSTWNKKKWSGLTRLYGDHVWTVENNIYCIYELGQCYILDKSK